MNYLELCTRVRQRADVAGSGLASVVGQVGILEKIVTWVDDAWSEIQLLEKWWLFRQESGTATLTTGTSEYGTSALLPSDFAYFWKDSIYIKDAGVKAGQLELIPWEEYRSKYLHEVLYLKQPSKIAITHNGKVYFDTLPDKDYTIAFDYQRTVQILAANSDIPTLPVDYHDVIWLRALAMYGEHYGAPEVYQPASLTLANKMDIISSEFLPKVSFVENAYYGTS